MLSNVRSFQRQAMCAVNLQANGKSSTFSSADVNRFSRTRAAVSCVLPFGLQELAALSRPLHAGGLPESDHGDRWYENEQDRENGDS
nr:hypothetical protein CFP56_56904 [Quercus suber]